MGSYISGCRVNVLAVSILIFLYAACLSTSILQAQESVVTSAPPAPECALDSQIPYEVLALNAIALQCVSPVAGTLSGSGDLFLGATIDPKASPMTSNVQSKIVGTHWVLLTWPSTTSATNLAPGKSYTFRLPALSIPPPPNAPPKFEPHLFVIDTTDTVSVVGKPLPKAIV